MSTKLPELLMEKLKGLPYDKQQEVLDFAEFLEGKVAQRRPRRSLSGLWAEFRVDITERDIAEVRSEMWKDFPRENVA